jgi:hypothetical protein
LDKATLITIAEMLVKRGIDTTMGDERSNNNKARKYSAYGFHHIDHRSYKRSCFCTTLNFQLPITTIYTMLAFEVLPGGLAVYMNKQFRLYTVNTAATLKFYLLEEYKRQQILAMVVIDSKKLKTLPQPYWELQTLYRETPV